MHSPVQLFNRAFLVLLGICLAVWFVWRTAYPTFAWHQRHTVTVVTPSGEVSGSAVTGMTVWTAPKTLPEAATIGFELTGEATVVEVLPGRYLFALVEGAAGWAGDTYAPLSVETDFRTRMRMVVRQRGNPPAEMPRDAWPRLVTFDDIADPTSVRLVDPDDLASMFGPGVSLKAMTLEVTREGVTEGTIDALLPWLGPYPETPLLPNINPTDFSFQALLRQGSFIARE